MLCKNCKFWENSCVKPKDEFEGLCRKLEGYAEDYGTETAGIWTRGKFGCILGEPK
jgi:hypothetical protein